LLEKHYANVNYAAFYYAKPNALLFCHSRESGNPAFAGMTYNPTSFGSSLIKSAYKVTIAENPQSKPRPLSEDILGSFSIEYRKIS
jgi:hypothetical protein